ncbi:hypothetical protein A7981_05060 [Methylovorus sp. MM2]|nr:hypothetical protein A7981_05060 [Methylovorus sp. MM2]
MIILITIMNYLMLLISHTVEYVLLCGAGILYWRSRTIPTAMFFFGALVATISPLIMFQLAINFRTVSYPPLFGLAPLIAKFIGTIGLLLYAISLPKKISLTHHSSGTPNGAP